MYEMLVGSGYSPVSYDEIMRAALWCDLALILFTAGAAWVESREKHKVNIRKQTVLLPLDSQIVSLVCITALAVGLPLWIIFRGFSNVQLGEAGGVGYVKLASNWPLVSIMSLIYIYGFRAYLVVPFCFFLFFNALQGYHRVMAVMPLLYVVLVYLERRKRKWPNLFFVVILTALFAVFPVLKYIGRAYKERDYQTISTLLRESANNSMKLSAEYAPDFLDQFACCLTLADETGLMYYGKHYTYLAVYMIPRAWWPNKPSFASYMSELGSPQRPVHIEGRIVTYLGEAYIHFRHIGMIMYPLLLSILLTKWYRRILLSDFNTVSKYAYVILAVSFLQVYRDGLPSLLMFTVVQNMPAMAVIAVHVFKLKKRKANVQKYFQFAPRLRRA